MSETDLVSTEAAPAPRKAGGLTGMVLAELRQLAAELNISGITGMRKGDLIQAIKEKQGAAATPAAQLELPANGAEPAPAAAEAVSAPAPSVNGAASVDAAPAGPAENSAEPAPAPTRRRRAASRPAAPRSPGPP
ncbi:hypothetical protein BJF78_12350 [Pseudonocardia sp. CNS-139]|nr:hypothetical protein BJF78_12350 [Pseudonocardia sp. CNS-139]